MSHLRPSRYEEAEYSSTQVIPTQGHCRYSQLEAIGDVV